MSDIPDTIERDVLVAADLETTWAVVSTPGWWINDGAALQLDLVETIDSTHALVRHPQHGDFTIETVSSTPPTAVVFRWVVSGAPDRRAAGTGAPVLQTTVAFALSAEPGGTRVRVVESGFATAAVDEAARRIAFDGNTEGWAIELGLLVATLLPRG